MARHRDIRNMDYEDEYDGYDDIYGHSVDDDYYISPTNRQFIYNRESSRDTRFEHEDDIQEVDEVDELSDAERAQLNSCIDEIRNTLGPVIISRSELVNLILKYKFNVELVINAILENPKYEQALTGPKDKDVTQLLFVKSSEPAKFENRRVNDPPSGLNFKGRRKKEQFTNDSSHPKGFVVPNIFGTKIDGVSGSMSGHVSKNFTIPNIFGLKTENSSVPITGSVTIPSTFNTKSDTNSIEQVDNVKHFAIPSNKFGEKSESNPLVHATGSPSRNFTIPKIFDSPLKLDRSNKVVNTAENFNTLSELVSCHLKNTLPVPKSSIDEVDLGINNDISENLSVLKLSEFPILETRSEISNNLRSDFDIDLSKALKTTSSLPNFSKNKENVIEKFHIPFIDGDLVPKKATLSKKKALPCFLNIINISDLNTELAKKPSMFGRVICTRYRRRDRFKCPLKLRYSIPNSIKVFYFNTQSPDDYISSHLKR